MILRLYLGKLSEANQFKQILLTFSCFGYFRFTQTTLIYYQTDEVFGRGRFYLIVTDSFIDETRVRRTKC